MSSSTRSDLGTSETRRPRRASRFARVALVVAWGAFWLNTAVSPCCEVLAAAFGDESESLTQSAPAAQPAHHSEATHAEHTSQSPASPCDHSFKVGPAIGGMCAGLPADHVYLAWLPIDESVVALPAASMHVVNLALRKDHPPPPHRLYLRTLRLLI